MRLKLSAVFRSKRCQDRTTELNKHSGMQPPVDPVNMKTKNNLHGPRIQENRMYINVQFGQISKDK